MNIIEILNIIIEPDSFKISYSKKEFIDYYNSVSSDILSLNSFNDIEIKDEDCEEIFNYNNINALYEINQAFDDKKIIIVLFIDDYNDETPNIVKSKYTLEDEDDFYPYFHYISNELLNYDINILQYTLDD